MKVKARYWKSFENQTVKCELCPHNCIIQNGKLGKCKVRANENGKLFAVNYGEITSIALDPIEKKPIYHFKPSSNILSVGSFGCNFKCSFCQNYMISQFKAKSRFISKEQLIQLSLSTRENIGIAFTYNEPSIWYEYVYDCAKFLKETDENSSVVLVTNGYINELPLKKLLHYVDAINIDLKSFSESYYNKLCGGNLNPVLRSIETAIKFCHVEITTLIVTGENDNIEEIKSIAKFLGNIDRNIPLHISRYFPRYKLNNSPTDINFMYNAKEIADKYLNNVHLGNI